MRRLLKKILPETIVKLLQRAEAAVINHLFRSRTIKAVSCYAIKGVAAFNRDAVVRFYSRYNHSSEGILKEYLAWAAYYAVIDPEIRSDTSSISRFSNLLFANEAGYGWSKALEGNTAYYLKDGISSCLTPIIGSIETSKRDDWRLIELGCGGGNCIAILSEHVGERVSVIDGVDFSSPAIGLARSRFDVSKHHFVAADLKEWLAATPANKDFRYDIAYSHLVLQLFPMEYVSEMFTLLAKKRVCKQIFISDSYCDERANLSVVRESFYNPDNSGYLRFDHNHAKLLLDSGFARSEILGDYRSKNRLVVVVGEVD